MRHSFTFRHRSHAGFSLVELMVSVVVGLLALLFATKLIVNGEQNKSAAVGGSDAMQNGMLALFSLSGDAAESGWGLNDPMVAGCDTVFNDSQGYALASAVRGGGNITPLAAAVIESNGADPDRISFYSGTSAAGVGSIKLTANYTGGNLLTTDTRAAYGFNNGDVLLVAPLAAGTCTLIQMSGFNAGANNNQLVMTAGDPYRYNQTAAMTTNYPQNAAYIYNLGGAAALHFHTWSARNGILLLRATDLPGASAQPVSVVDNIVSIKAQYGFDTRVIPNYNPNPGILNSSGMQIGQWSPVMINADGDGVVGGAGDYQRIAAVRLAVVARSKTSEKPNLAGQCTATTALPVVFAGVAPANVAAVPMTVNVAVAGDPVDWKCYRYRVFETIVQIRNAQWRPG